MPNNSDEDYELIKLSNYVRTASDHLSLLQRDVTLLQEVFSQVTEAVQEIASSHTFGISSHLAPSTDFVILQSSHYGTYAIDANDNPSASDTALISEDKPTGKLDFAQLLSLPQSMKYPTYGKASIALQNYLEKTARANGCIVKALYEANTYHIIPLTRKGLI